MTLTLFQISANTAVFLDANLFVYHFAPHPSLQAPCQQLLERIVVQELIGYTSAHVLTNVAHRIMTLEAIDRFGWPMTGIAQRLQRHWDQFGQLTRFREIIDEILAMGIRVLPITAGLVSAAAAVSQQNGLLSGDALVVASMREQGLTHLASHDADFDRVSGLTRYAPV
jgi:predicted nucleic acid-binding protein